MLLLDQEFDHVAHRVLGGFLQILAESHGDIVGRAFPRAARASVPVLVDDKAGRFPLRVGLERGDIDLAVALGGVAVAGLEQRALDAPTGIYSVVPATSSLLSMLPACANGGALSILPPAPAAPRPCCRKTDAAESRFLGAKFAIIALRSSGMILLRLYGYSIGRKPRPRPKPLHAKLTSQVHFEYLHFEHIAWLRLCDGDGPRQNMARRAPCPSLRCRSRLCRAGCLPPSHRG